MSACIIPVAPNFQDPPSPPDSPPYFSGFSPMPGPVVTVPDPDGQGQVFSASVTDQDVNATIFARWIIDYPPYGSNTRYADIGPFTPPTDGVPIGHPVSQAVTCGLLNSTMAPPNGIHLFEFVVADRPLSNDLQNLEATNDGTGIPVLANWTFVISCQAGSTSASQ